jgi:hypothetical protein
MEGKRTKKKTAYFFVLAATIACVTLGSSRTALAQFPVGAFNNPVVAPNGVGDLLIFPFWAVSDSDTLVAIVNPVGSSTIAPGFNFPVIDFKWNGADVSTFVHIIVREGVNSQEVLNFTICLTPGDMWTAAMTTRGGQPVLIVNNPGDCIPFGESTPNEPVVVAANGFTSRPPVPGQAVSLGGATFGYIEAYTMGAFRGDTFIGGDDAIAGVATLVNVNQGFSSSYTATALVGFNAFNESAAITNAVGIGTVGLVGNRSNVQRAVARESGVDKEILLTRWITNPLIGARSSIVLTFPAGGQPGSDPVSTFIFNEDQGLTFSPSQKTLPREVNICTFDFIGLESHLLCNGESPSPATLIQGSGEPFTAGWVRIINNRLGTEVFNLEELPVTRFPVIGLTFSFFDNGDDDFDQSFPIQWMAVRGAGATTVAGSQSPVAFGIPAPSSAPYYTALNVPCTFPFLGSNLCVPGDNISAGLARTGTGAP